MSTQYLSHILSCIAVIRRWLALVLYSTGCLLVLLGALVPTSRPIVRELVIVRDVSDSVGQEESLPDFVHDFAQTADQAQMIWVADRARLGKGLAETPAQNLKLDRGITDLAAGLNFARSLPLAGPTRRRILLVSDGLSTIGDPVQAAKSLSQESRVETVAIGGIPTPDARLCHLVVPGTVEQGKAFVAKVALTSARTTRAEVSLYHKGMSLGKRSVLITPAGVNVSFSTSIANRGLQILTASVSLQEDTVPANDSAKTAVLVAAPGRTFWIGTPPEILRDTVIRKPPGVINPTALQQCGRLVLENQPAHALPPGTAGILRDAVGRGMELVVIGGPDSLGPGGYGPGLGALLPVKLMPKNGLGVVFVLDISSSMGEKVPGSTSTKLDLAVTAVHEACRRLAVDDMVGVFACNLTVRRVFPLTTVDDNQDNLTGLHRNLLTLQDGGGTKLFPAIRQALQMLGKTRVARRHIMVVSDGDTAEKPEEIAAGMKMLRNELAKRAATMSVITVGAEPDHAFLKELETLSGVRVIRAGRDMVRLDSIFSRQLREVREFIKKQGKVSLVGSHQIVRGLHADSLPMVKEFVAVGTAKEKKGAVTLVSTAKGEVLAAVWRFGLGRAAVTAGRPWKDWGWNEPAHTLLKQLLEPPDYGTGEEIETSVTGGWLLIRFGNSRAGVATITPLPGTVVDGQQVCQMIPVAPDLYEGKVPAPPRGSYRIDLYSTDQNTLLGSAPLLIEERREWLRFGSDHSRLQEIALAGGGNIVVGIEGFSSWDEIPVSGGTETPHICIWLIVAGGVVFLMGMAASAWR